MFLFINNPGLRLLEYNLVFLLVFSISRFLLSTVLLLDYCFYFIYSLVIAFSYLSVIDFFPPYQRPYFAFGMPRAPRQREAGRENELIEA